MANISVPKQRDFGNLPVHDDLDRIILHAAEIIANQSPWRTGNLRIYAIKVEWLDVYHTAFRIYIDEDAIYAKTGKKMLDGTIKKFDYADWLETDPRSPHRGWFERACADAANYIRSVIG